MTGVDLKKGSYNRLWIVLGALAHKDGTATLKELSELVGMPRSTTEDILKKVLDKQVPELVLHRENATFIVKTWGSFLPKKNLLNYYNKHCSNG